MKLLKLLVTISILSLLSSVAFAQDDISISTGIVAGGKYLGAKTTDNQTIVPALSIDSSGNTVINSLSGKTVGFQNGKVTGTTMDATGITPPSIKTIYESVAGAGTSVTDAAALSGTKFVHQITGANGTLGWKFVTATPVLSIQILLNTTAGVAKIYGESGSTVNGGSTDAAFSALTGIKPIICIKTAALTYICA